MNTFIFNPEKELPLKKRRRMPSWLKKLGVLLLTTLGWFGNQVYTRYKGMDEMLRVHSEAFVDVKWEIKSLRREIDLEGHNRKSLSDKVDRIESKLDKWFEPRTR